MQTRIQKALERGFTITFTFAHDGQVLCLVTHGHDREGSPAYGVDPYRALGLALSKFAQAAKAAG